MTHAANRRSILRMAGLAAGVAAFTGARSAGAAAGDPLILGEVNEGSGKTTVLRSDGLPTLQVESADHPMGGRGTALLVKGQLHVSGGPISLDGRRGGLSVNARDNAITAVTRFRGSKSATIEATHMGAGTALEGRSETKNWYGAGVFSWGTLVVRPGCGIALIPKGDTSVDVSFDKGITLGEESIVLATPQAGAEVAVKHAYFLDEKTLRITLVEPAPAPTKVGYLVVKWT